MAQGVNNNAAVVVVGRTAPVPPGQQTAANSVPVVIASDQTAIPVEEQNKQQSEVALSLLGIPRSEVALGIFADVNTYDVNPTEWSVFPEQFSSADIRNTANEITEKYTGLLGEFDWGLTHIAEEAGAMIEAPADEYSILTSKRFFRYQPGRVSAATFGVKLNRAPYTVYDPTQATLPGYGTNNSVRNPAIKKYGIFDKFDGYYFESRNDGHGDNFTVVRRTQSIIRDSPLPFGGTVGFQDQDYAWVGVPQTESNGATYPNAYEVLKANKRYLQEVAAQSMSDSSEAPKCRRDAGLVIEGILHDLKYGGNASTVYNTLRFFNKETKGVYLDNVATEISRYQAIRNVCVAILNGSTPSTTGLANNSYTGSTAEGTIGHILPSAITVTPESTADDQVTILFNILLIALGDGSAGPQYSSIPDPVGSAAGEMCILRDGLVMIHGAAHDPSLLKEKTNYSIVALFNDPSSAAYKWLKVQVPAGAELLQLGQGVSLQKNEAKGYFRDTNNVQTPDGSIWYIQEILKQDNTGASIFQYVRLCRNPSNEEIFTGVGGTNTTNPWTGDSNLAYADVGAFDIVSAWNTSSGTPVQINEVVDITNVSTLGFTLQTPVPFILPNDARRYTGIQYTDESRPGFEGTPAGSVDGCFPYLYPPSGSADPQSQGYVDSVFSDTADIKAQINYVNRRLFKNWTWFNVDPKYYKVYEYRVPRSRMSDEKLNGTDTPIIYSDNVLDSKAGAPVLEPTTGEQKTFESVWDLDPTKVTMYKIEFSWYGAVGATFLAYVPIENNEARWVRVHHLRASNQLKVASLGNATLPITYMCYGGGGQNSFGYLNAQRRLNTESGYGSCSEQLTKYGASYYIDGGDRGTVRLFSYAADNLKEIGGSKYLFVGGTGPTENPSLFANTLTYGQTTVGPTYVNAPYLTFSATGLNGAPAISDYYQNARVVTDNASDQDVRVVWVDVTNRRLYLSRILNATSGNVRLIVDRPQPLVGVKCRTEINGVRNRVQIYPTRLATGVTSNSESMVVQLIKTPVFQTFTNATGTLSINNNSGIDIGKRGKKTLLPIGAGVDQITVSTNYIPNKSSIWGYFRYTIKGDTSGLAFTTLGLLSRDDLGSTVRYYFSAYQVSIDDHIIRGSFLPAGRWSGPGPNSPDLSSIASPFPTTTLARLSAVETDSEQRSPIPGTGTVITTLFSPNSGEQYELSPYFDYNKDYLSFPLTDIQETLYICASSKSFFKDGGGTGAYVNRGEILASITWEEQ
jgi:hypothetical protein